MVQNIVVCNPTIKTDNIFDFLHAHLDCDAIVDMTNELNNLGVEILAYAMDKGGNKELDDYYVKQKYKEPIYIVQGISSMEVDCIDYVVA